MDNGHVLADGGGRELAYVAMSRARQTNHIYSTGSRSGGSWPSSEPARPYQPRARPDIGMEK